MRFGITFVKGDITPSFNTDHFEYGEQVHTYRDWGLVPAKRPVVPPPEVREQIIEVESMDGGGIDLTESLTGYPTFKDREASFEFYRQKDDNWNGGMSKILNWIHGEKIKMILDDDPAYYYEGRISVSDLESDKYYSKISLKAKMNPYKMYVYESDVQEKDILFDLIDFGRDSFTSEEYIWKKEPGQTVASTPSFIVPPRPMASYLALYVKTLTNPSGATLRVRCKETGTDSTSRGSSMTFKPQLRRNSLYSIRIPPEKEVRISCAYLGSIASNVAFNMEFSVLYRKGEL